MRHWRSVRRLSQLDVSGRTGVSTRHLSCVETGRAKPSRELLLYLADEFEMPKRAVNDMLLAGGFAPVFSEYSLDDDALAAARDVIRLVLDGNDPNPTTVIDTRWNVVDANAAAFWFTASVDPALLTSGLNVARLSLHPDGLAARVTNFDEYAGQLLRHMRHVLVLTQDDELRALIDECETYAPAAARTMPTAPGRCAASADRHRWCRAVVPVDRDDVWHRSGCDVVGAVDRDALPGRSDHSGNLGGAAMDRSLVRSVRGCLTQRVIALCHELPDDGTHEQHD